MMRPSTTTRYKPECDFEDEFALFLHRCAVAARWLLVVCCWLAFGVPAMWFLRREFGLWLDFFSWAAMWYAFRVNPWPAFGLLLSFGLTLSTLMWQSRNILFGLAARELAQRHDEAQRLRTQGSRSTLWMWFGIWRRDRA
ncbi:MAG: hypothetical protein ACFB9N_02155 [Geitlerinemataceae cyanobacterium]